MRGQVLAVQTADFVWAARSVGATPLRVMLRHVLPNSLSPVLVMATLQAGSVVVETAGLSFLGLGRAAAVTRLGRAAGGWARAIF